MKNSQRLHSLTTAVLAVGCLMAPIALRAAIPDSSDVTKLLTDTKAVAFQLNKDSAQMDSFTRSKVTWKAYQAKIEVIKGHINNAGKLLGSLKAAESTGSPWQQQTIKRIEPQLQEMASNLTATINYLNANPGKIHIPEFTDYVKTNYALSSDMLAMLNASLDYGADKAKLEALSSK
jgi:hypothetical protein